MPRKTLEERFWPKVDRRGDDECWAWLPSKNHGGYGSFYVAPRCVPAHRVAYELLIGPIPEGLHIDHLCRNPSCVNPAHLEPVTCRENVLRGIAPTAENAHKTECKRGHPLTGANVLYDQRGHRVCRTCKRARWRAAYRTQQAEEVRARDEARAEWGVLRDASGYRAHRPDTWHVPLYHVPADETMRLTACGRDAAESTAERVGNIQPRRCCQRPGCKERWPESTKGAD